MVGPVMGVQVLDAVTLKQLKSFNCPPGSVKLLTFSTESHFFTWVGSGPDVVISWDLQTGVLASEIPIEVRGFGQGACSLTYSGCRTMFGVLFGYNPSTISTFNVPSSTPTYHHPIKGLVAGII
jgi:WD40 repeat protein